jgi:hypothetical protein
VHVGWGGRHDEAALRRQVVEAAQSGRLLVVARARPKIVPPKIVPKEEVAEAVVSAVSSAPAKKLDWISFVVEDEDGRPVGGKAYELTAADGSVRRGVTSAQGLVNVTGIAPGSCKFSLVDTDAAAWDRA